MGTFFIPIESVAQNAPPRERHIHIIFKVIYINSNSPQRNSVNDENKVVCPAKLIVWPHLMHSWAWHMFIIGGHLFNENKTYSSTVVKLHFKTYTTWPTMHWQSDYPRLQHRQTKSWLTREGTYELLNTTRWLFLTPAMQNLGILDVDWRPKRIYQQLNISPSAQTAENESSHGTSVLVVKGQFEDKCLPYESSFSIVK